MLDPVGFWSYTRHDDVNSDGELSQLRVIVGKAIALQLGKDVTLWQDISAIPYGADWSETIDHTLEKTTFFMPIVTPRYLNSANCRDEYAAFRHRMANLGRNDLVFPIHYVGVEEMVAEETAFAEHLGAIRRHQWIDYRALFYTDPRSPDVRRWAGRLATSILTTLRRSNAVRPEETRVPEILTKSSLEALPTDDRHAESVEPEASTIVQSENDQFCAISDDAEPKASVASSVEAKRTENGPSPPLMTEAAIATSEAPPPLVEETEKGTERPTQVANAASNSSLLKKIIGICAGFVAFSLLIGSLYYASLPSIVPLSPFEKLSNAAAKGDLAAMTNLGYSYHLGNGVAQDYREARAWDEKAAGLGSAMAMFNLAILLQGGKGGAQDLAAAQNWFDKAMKAGCVKQDDGAYRCPDH